MTKVHTKEPYMLWFLTGHWARILPGTFTHDATTRMMAMNRGDLPVPDMCKAMSYVTLPVVI